MGRLVKIATWGESHGPGIGVVIDGLPPNVAISATDIQQELDRRKPGQSSLTTPRKESDTVQILSGLFEGKTTGTPLALYIQNQQQQSRDYTAIKDTFRPGHADFTYQKKFGLRDYRGGGRASGRETAARVAAGAVAKKILAGQGISLTAYTIQVGAVVAVARDLSLIETNDVRCPDADAAVQMAREIHQAREDNDSVGGMIEAVVTGVPAGLGDPAFDKLDALIGQALFSIGAVKGVEIGDGFQVAGRRGSENNDAFITVAGEVRLATNHAGGILGGISTGDPLVVRCAVKPTPSIAKEQHTVAMDGTPETIQVTGRHDPCLCPRMVPVIESMLAVVLLDCLLVHRAYAGFH